MDSGVVGSLTTIVPAGGPTGTP